MYVTYRLLEFSCKIYTSEDTLTDRFLAPITTFTRKYITLDILIEKQNR